MLTSAMNREGIRRSASFRAQVHAEALSLMSYRSDIPLDARELQLEITSRSRPVTDAQRRMVASQFGPNEVQMDEETFVFRNGEWQQSYPIPCSDKSDRPVPANRK